MTSLPEIYLVLSCLSQMENLDILSIKWKDFPENISSSLGSLRENQDFTDVTLACEDGLQVEAHKVILAASSPFFSDLLREAILCQNR